MVIVDVGLFTACSVLFLQLRHVQQFVAFIEKCVQVRWSLWGSNRSPHQIANI